MNSHQPVRGRRDFSINPSSRPIFGVRTGLVCGCTPNSRSPNFSSYRGHNYGSGGWVGAEANAKDRHSKESGGWFAIPKQVYAPTSKDNGCHARQQRTYDEFWTRLNQFLNSWLRTWLIRNKSVILRFARRLQEAETLRAAELRQALELAWGLSKPDVQAVRSDMLSVLTRALNRRDSNRAKIARSLPINYYSSSFSACTAEANF